MLVGITVRLFDRLVTVLNGVSAKHRDSFYREPDTGWEWQISDGPYASGLEECLEFVYFFFYPVSGDVGLWQFVCCRSRGLFCTDCSSGMRTLL